jgi:hypothetical protein
LVQLHILLSSSLKKHIDENYVQDTCNKADLEVLSPEEKQHGSNWFKVQLMLSEKNFGITCNIPM